MDLLQVADKLDRMKIKCYWNVYMKNVDGKHFLQKQFSYGLTSDFGLFSFVNVDYDNDGDLDIIGNSAEGPVQVFENSATGKNRSIAVSLKDPAGNRFGIGAKIHVSSGTLTQTREIKASGGYQSINAPIAHFGLGAVATVDELKVVWRDGKSTVVAGPLAADFHYHIERVK